MFTAMLAATAVAACTAASPAHPVTLVELYTSQGCSSCPPADHWLSQLRPDDRVIPLSLHVGYWDYIGWKDPFAKREFNARQRQLATLNRNGTVYTPGVFVQGREIARWRDPAALDAVVRDVAAGKPQVTVTLTAAVQGQTVTIRPSATAAAGTDPQLWVALTQDGLRTAVKAGENRGETLRNDHVVREWSGPWPLAGGQVVWPFPLGATPDRLTVVAFAADRATGRPLQAVQLPLGSCTK